jgi:phosphohistidine phosphatase
MLFRHAKAEQVPGMADVERELTARGRRDAQAAGAWLREQGLGAELVLCSPSVRTRQTWDHAVTGGACGEAVSFPGLLYSGGVGGVLQAIREEGDEAQVLMVVGHNPSMAALASILSEGDGSRDAHDALAAGFPTSTVAVLRYRGAWLDLAPATAALERCHISRG